ncbi:unnamed protein product [Chrysoparadoxa australica]
MKIKGVQGCLFSMAPIFYVFLCGTCFADCESLLETDPFSGGLNIEDGGLLTVRHKETEKASAIAEDLLELGQRHSHCSESSWLPEQANMLDETVALQEEVEERTLTQMERLRMEAEA